MNSQILMTNNYSALYPYFLMEVFLYLYHPYITTDTIHFPQTTPPLTSPIIEQGEISIEAILSKGTIFL